MEVEKVVNKIIRDIPNFPSKGVIFKDITPLLLDINLYNKVIDSMAHQYRYKNVTKIVGLEARGFIFAISLAQKLKVPFVPIRKKGKLPYRTISKSYNLEYGSTTIEIHIDAISEKDNILIVDDLLATGGTASAAIELVKKLKGNVLGCAFVIELAFLNGRKKLKNVPYTSIVRY